MAYCGYITRLKNLHKHPNADKLQIGECFGNFVIVSMEYEDNQLGIYFPSDGQLSAEFAEANNLLRKKDENGNNIGGYMDPNKRNITAIKLRGEKSDGLFLPLKSLEKFGDITELTEGSHIDVFNGHEICKKYIPVRKNGNTTIKGGPRKKKVKAPLAPTFYEHVDTEQLAYNLNAFLPNDEIEITLKLHGTSQRTGYLPVFKGWKVKNKFFQGIVNKYATSSNLSTFARKCIDIAMRGATPIYNWDYVSGTRRVVLDNYEGGYYGSNEFREQWHNFFKGKLLKGETVYYEVVGFTHTGAPIMSTIDNRKLNDKEFIKKYGKETVFSYGCDCAEQAWREDRGQGPNKPESDIYVYRMTMTNEDGDAVEYPPDFMRYRCEQIGVKTVPVMDRFILHDFDLENDTRTAGEIVKYVAEKYYDGPDPIGKTHIREGVVVRILNRPQFKAYKHKNWYFKALEGIVKVEAEAPDMEEAEELTAEAE